MHTLDHMNRRRFVKTALMLGGGLLSGLGLASGSRAALKKKVYIVKTDNRVAGIDKALSQFDLSGFSAMTVAIKANYNSADEFPASTHPETLRTLARSLKDAGAGDMTLVERSGMGNTAEVLKEMGALDVARELDFDVVVMDDLAEKDFLRYSPPGSNWREGFLLERHFVESARVVQTCCLKTHQYGGHFTMSLKNPVGAIAKVNPETGYNYMSELHGSALQRSLIAEISKVYRNDLIVMDGMEAFVTGGPHQGRKVKPGVIVVSDDPVAVDAVGVAILRMYGTTDEVMRGRIFDQEQIRRAADLRVGVDRPQDIELVTMDEESKVFAGRIMDQLLA